MNPTLRVAAPPAKALLVYDGDCRFCALWVRRWQQIAGDRLDVVPFQGPVVASRFPELTAEQFAAAVHLIQTDGAVCSGARAVFASLALNRTWRWLFRAYDAWPPFARVSERGYRFVAEHRRLFSGLTRIGWGEHVGPPTHELVRSIFLRGLGLIYLVAFVSLGSQLPGLIGEGGILPVGQFMADAGQDFDARGVGADRVRLLPTLCWFDASDAALRWQCSAGVVLAALLVIGIAPMPCLCLLWVLYLSLATVCREFLGFQWDVLLLETGFFAIWIAPLQLWPFGNRPPSPPSRAALWLLRWLLFQLMFESGVVKLTSGDPTWRNLTALTFHYETQPLPTWIGWHAHQLPVWFQQASCAVMFFIELAVPLLFFAPRRLRFFAGAATALLQVLILLTGNYTFFNWLALLLCVPLLDDQALRRWLPRRWRRVADREPARDTIPTRGWPRWIVLPVTAATFSLTAAVFLASLGVRWPMLSPLFAVHESLSPFRTFNSYGLFRVMTTTRPEIVLEGSRDGVNWLAYEFRYKPGDLRRRPAFVAPHQPRLDWQMWFAALGQVRQNPWFGNFVVRLLQGSPEVLALLERNPFPDAPPRYIRAVLYEYRFTNRDERRATGAWWKRKQLGLYLEPVSLPRGDGQKGQRPTVARTQTAAGTD